MLDQTKHLPAVQSMLQTAKRILGYDLLERCTNGEPAFAAPDLKSSGYAKQLQHQSTIHFAVYIGEHARHISCSRLT